MKNKTGTISVRLTHDELKTIEEKAESDGMNRNKYIVTSLINRQDGIDPALLCRLRHIQAITGGYFRYFGSANTDPYNVMSEMMYIKECYRKKDGRQALISW